MPTTKIKKFKSKSSFKMKKKLSKSKSKSKNRNRKNKSLSRKRNYRRKNKLIGGTSFANVASNVMAVKLEHCYPITDNRFKDYKTFTLKFSNMLFKNCSQEYKQKLEGLVNVDLNNITEEQKTIVLDYFKTVQQENSAAQLKENSAPQSKNKWKMAFDKIKEQFDIISIGC